MKQMWNEIFFEMGLQYVDDESIFEHFKKLCKRWALVLFWSPFYFIMKMLKGMGIRINHEQ